MDGNLKKGPLKIIFAVRAVENYVYAKSIIENLALRGHKLEVIFDRRYSSKDLGHLGNSKISGVKYRWALVDYSYWRKIFYNCQDILSWRRYFLVKNQSLFYRQRWVVYLPLIVKYLVKFPLIRKIIISDFTARLLRSIVDLTPVPPKVVDDLEKFEADVVVATPANMPYSSCDQEYLRAAKSLKIPTVVPVFSWDNLTTKGLFHAMPDLLLVWNETQVNEAWRHHQISKKDIKVCGAFLFDFWFRDRQPSQSREEFCKKWGLAANKPILCYLETSESLTGDERWLVGELKGNLKGARDVRLKNTQIIVRPHPFKSHFSDFKLPGVFVIPNIGTWSKGSEVIQLYFDTLFYSFAVLGINTSGFIDAVICDKPIVALSDDNFKKTQVETEHFKQLLENDVVEIAKREDLTRVLAHLLAGKDTRKSKRKNFIRKFIRPTGLENNAGELATHEIESLLYLDR